MKINGGGRVYIYIGVRVYGVCVSVVMLKKNWGGGQNLCYKLK